MHPTKKETLVPFAPIIWLKSVQRHQKEYTHRMSHKPEKRNWYNPKPAKGKSIWYIVNSSSVSSVNSSSVSISVHRRVRKGMIRMEIPELGRSFWIPSYPILL